jgi:uncharacterized linocin/CFP29 family protein
MNHLMRELAPITDEAWTQIDEEASRSLKHFLAARRLVDFTGPLGWGYSAVDTGRIESLPSGPLSGVDVASRTVVPLVELRAPFALDPAELAADLPASMTASRSMSVALAEDHLVFHGYEPGGVAGLITASPHQPVAISDDYSHYPEHVAKAVAALRSADVAGPYAIALGARCFTGVTETTEHGGYPVFEHLHQILDGPVVWAPAVDGAVVLSQRSGDFELTIGEDFSIGYRSSTATSIDLYIEESLTFRINTPQAAVHLAYL